MDFFGEFVDRLETHYSYKTLVEWMLHESFEVSGNSMLFAKFARASLVFYRTTPLCTMWGSWTKELPGIHRSSNPYPQTTASAGGNDMQIMQLPILVVYSLNYVRSIVSIYYTCPCTFFQKMNSMSNYSYLVPVFLRRQVTWIKDRKSCLTVMQEIKMCGFSTDWGLSLK